MSGDVRGCPGMSGDVRRCPGMSGDVRRCPGMSGRPNYPPCIPETLQNDNIEEKESSDDDFQSIMDENSRTEDLDTTLQGDEGTKNSTIKAANVPIYKTLDLEIDQNIEKGKIVNNEPDDLLASDKITNDKIDGVGTRASNPNLADALLEAAEDEPTEARSQQPSSSSKTKKTTKAKPPTKTKSNPKDKPSTTNSSNKTKEALKTKTKAKNNTPSDNPQTKNMETDETPEKTPDNETKEVATNDKMALCLNK